MENSTIIVNQKVNISDDNSPSLTPQKTPVKLTLISIYFVLVAIQLVVGSLFLGALAGSGSGTYQQIQMFRYIIIIIGFISLFLYIRFLVAFLKRRAWARKAGVVVMIILMLPEFLSLPNLFINLTQIGTFLDKATLLEFMVLYFNLLSGLIMPILQGLIIYSLLTDNMIKERFSN